MASSESKMCGLRIFRESLVKAYYPEARSNPAELAKRVEEVLYDLDGVLLNALYYPRAAIEEVKSFKPRKGDIMIAASPRSGEYYNRGYHGSLKM